MAKRLSIEGEAAVLGDLREAARRLISESPYTATDLQEIIGDLNDELYEEDAIDNDPDLQVDR